MEYERVVDGVGLQAADGALAEHRLLERHGERGGVFHAGKGTGVRKGKAKPLGSDPAIAALAAGPREMRFGPFRSSARMVGARR
jgi:hypothetical protein